MAEIGISTKILPRAYWDNELERLPFKAVELNLAYSALPSNEKVLKEIVLPKLSKYDISMHSRTDLFHSNPLISDVSNAVIKLDMWYAELMKVREMVFHISRVTEKIDFEYLRNLTSEFKGKLLLENSRAGTCSSSERIIDILRKVPELGFCLDVGHPRIANDQEDVGNEIEFIKSMKKHIDYVHIHGNDGETDLHNAFELDKKNVEILKLIKRINPRKIIIETRTKSEAMKTLENIKPHF